jgi:hypothetical protein
MEFLNHKLFPWSPFLPVNCPTARKLVKLREEKLYFVAKIVLTYFEKKLF